MKAADKQWSPAEVANRTGWRLVPEDKTDYVFSGDAVMLNDKLSLVVGRKGPDAELYTRTSGGMRHRATLGKLAMSSLKVGPMHARIIENNSGSVMLEVVSAVDPNATVRYRLTTGEMIVEARGATSSGSIHALTQSRYVVVPDYFGDDMVFDATTSNDTPLPAENFCLNLIEGGDAMMMSVWQSNEQEASISRAKTANGDALSFTGIQCLAGKSVWFAFFETPGIWHAEPGPEAPGWKPAFPSRWRASIVRKDGVGDSWDAEGRPGAAQALGVHHGPMVIYPIDRTTATPLTAACPTDVMRNTLGVGPCQYILACEGLGAQGDPTPNSVMNWVEKQFEQKKEKKVADEIRERLEIMTAHVSQARTNLARYARFAAEVRKRVAADTGADAAIDRSIIDDLDGAVARGLEPTASPELAEQLAHEVSALIGKGASAEGCRELGARLRALGASQDRALAQSRMCVRRLRHQGVPGVPNGRPESRPVQEVRKLAVEFLQNK